jgi:hypothetical protein
LPSIPDLYKIELFIARAFTPAGTDGNIAILTNENCKLQVGDKTAMNEIRTDDMAALGPGTRTLDTQPVGIAASFVHANGEQIFERPVELLVTPIRLRGNMGLIAVATVPTTGTWRAGFQMTWDEYQQL